VASLDTSDGASTPNTPADEALWHATRALRRHRGRTCYYTRIFDVEAGEERDPSSLFLQAERATSAQSGKDGEEAGGDSQEEGVFGLVPPETALSLSEGEDWLRASRMRSSDSESAVASTARQLLDERYPWVLRGETARQARQSGTYTVHDGLLPPGRYPDLDLFRNDGRPLSASRLETLAEAPYIYFLKYVLGVRPLDEPALDDEPWLNRLRKGTLLHDIYETFLRRLGRAPGADDASLLESVVEEVLEDEAEKVAPPSPVVKKAARRELLQNAMLFLRAEIERGDEYTPERFELGFGFPPHRREPQDWEGAASLSVGEHTLRLRGRVDRVDRQRETGALAAWDYKTGTASAYDDEDPLQDGKTLQWALYAYALESLLGDPVEESGYFFATVKEMGNRASPPILIATETMWNRFSSNSLPSPKAEVFR